MSSSFINAAMYLHSIKLPLNELNEQGTNSVTDIHHRKNSAVSKGTYILHWNSIPLGIQIQIYRGKQMSMMAAFTLLGTGSSI